MKNYLRYLPNTQTNNILNENFFIYQFYKSSQKLSHKFNQSIAKFGIISVQFAILYLIQESKEPNQKQLGEGLGIDKASMVKFLNGLEELNYITRTEDQTDRRIKIVSLTTQGMKVVKQINIIRLNVEKKFLSDKLTLTEMRSFYSLMRKIASQE